MASYSSQFLFEAFFCLSCVPFKSIWSIFPVETPKLPLHPPKINFQQFWRAKFFPFSTKSSKCRTIHTDSSQKIGQKRKFLDTQFDVNFINIYWNGGIWKTSETKKSVSPLRVVRKTTEKLKQNSVIETAEERNHKKSIWHFSQNFLSGGNLK